MKIHDLVETHEIIDNSKQQAFHSQMARSYEFWRYRVSILKKYLNYNAHTPLKEVQRASSTELCHDKLWSHFWQQDSRIPQPILDKYGICLQRMLLAKTKYEELGGKY